MIKANKPGDTVKIPVLNKPSDLVDKESEVKITHKTPELDGEATPNVDRELSLVRVGDSFMLSVNGISTILNKDQATFIGTRILAGITELARQTPPPFEQWRDEER